MKIIKYFVIILAISLAIFAVYGIFFQKKDINSLPFVSNNGKKFYYIRYEAVDSENRKFGIAYFIFPIFVDKKEFFKLEYDPPLYDFEDLLKGDGYGSKGFFEVNGDVFHSDILPFIAPIQKNEWRMIYRKNEYRCRKTRLYKNDEFVSCSSGKATLSYRFKRDVGVDQYDDFCGQEVCRFRLRDEIGIFSDAQLQQVGLMNTRP